MLASTRASWRALPWPVQVGLGLGLGLAAVASVVVRLAPLLADFPFGDGGLFWVMAADLRNNGFAPPMFTSFNFGDIPWMYPPIGLYLLAVLGDGLEWLRILPVLWALATLPAVWLLARALVGDRAAWIATTAYGLTVPAYFGLLAGGGVTRGPGVVLAVLAMWAVARGHARRAGVFGGLVIMAHPIAAFYGGLACLALWATRGAPRRMLLAPVVALVMGAAWFGPMIARHGADALLQSGSSRPLDLVENLVTVAGATLNPPNLAFVVGLVGVVVAARQRRWDLLAWLGVTMLGGAVLDRWVVIPLAVLAGLAVDAALAQPTRLRSVALLGVATAVSLTGVLLAGSPGPPGAQEREIMAWASAETETDATFAIIGYSFDGGVVDWFPAISDRRSVTTWQGTEWIGGGYRGAEAKAWMECRSLSCLPNADYYVLRPDCCPELAVELREVRPGVYVRGR